MIATATQHKSD